MKRLSLPAILLTAAVCTAWLTLPLPAFAQEEREDNQMNIGNTGQLRTGQDERGNNVMSIEKKPQTKQEMPDIGPIYVYPEVNTGRRPGPGPRPPRTSQTPQVQPQQATPGSTAQPAPPGQPGSVQ